MKKLSMLGVTALSLWIVTAALAAGDGGAANRSTDKVAAPDATAADAEMALQLADWGRANQSAEALAAAAQILAASAPEAAAMEKTTETGEGEAAEKADEPAPAVDAEALLGEAKAMAKQQKAKNLGKHLDGLALGTRGATGGPKFTVDKVQAHTTDIFVVEFQGGQFAEVAVVGDGDTDLDLYVYDQYGNLIASDADSTDTTYVSWVPAWTGAFRIEIKNLGAVYNQYTMLTN